MDERTVAKALEVYYDNLISEAEKNMFVETYHSFTADYEMRKRQLLNGKQFTGTTTVRNPVARKRRGIHILVAALIIALFLSITALAVARPGLVTNIKKYVTEWVYSFISTEERSDSNKFEPVCPEPPDGYSIRSKTETDDLFTVMYTNKDDSTIVYQQSFPEASTIGLDAEGEEINETKLSGHIIHYAISGDTVSMIFNDDTYVYFVTGDCGYETAEKLIDSFVRE